jgi:predicted GTPase
LGNQTILNTEILQQIPAIFTENSVDINAMMKEFTLNTEQARALEIICEHSMGLQNEPLKMYIGDAGGTGKSRVINALKVYFE